MSRFRNLLWIGLVLGGPALLPAAAAMRWDLPQRTDLSAADLARVSAVTAPTADFSKPEAFEAMQGGAGTSTKLVNRDSFSLIAANQSFSAGETFNLGNGFFTKFWVAAPSSTQSSDGLGPLFNARSCQSCHLKDGRGHPPAEGETAVSLFLRLSVPARTAAAHAALAEKTLLRIPEPTYGGQFQNFSVPGVPAEGRMDIAYEERPVTLADGTSVSLRHPTYKAVDLAYGPMAPDVELSPRITPPMIGLGLLEQVPEADILSRADPDDADKDGISGRASMVRDPETHALTLGRFGWKASTPSIKVQSAEAFSGDLGISTTIEPGAAGDCTAAETACRSAPTGVQAALGPVEAPDDVLDLVSFYARNLAVPARRNVADASVLKGKGAFYQAGCAACHTPKFVTSRQAPDAPQRFQLIWPYTDLLLHDMGEGLADGAAVGDAGPREWRTPPLWGIGLTKTVNGHTFFLHDGRARDLTEAILWHGGEAQASRDAFAGLGKADRDAMLAFLESL